MLESKCVSIPMEYGTKLSKLDGQESIDPTLLKKSLIRSLRFLTCIKRISHLLWNLCWEK